MTTKNIVTDKYGFAFEEGQLVTAEGHKWLYKTMLTEDGKLLLRGLNCKHSHYLVDGSKYEIIGELNDRMRDVNG